MSENRKATIGIIIIISLVLLRAASGEKEQMGQMFSRGLRLIVEAPRVRADRQAAPKARILLPAGVQRPSERVTLACVITGLRSKAVSIAWKVNRATGLETHGSSPLVQREPGGTFSAVGLYSVLPQERSGEDTYRCEVTYRAAAHYDTVESSLCTPPEGP
ncbi:uncharacterized protein si:ch211-1a19.2 [Puntigrus tetrazona]|uniref:uncharacterized protein si:ch211-1a19.2 n=1 Tax=Puntigrus tetrazona TaxID=1606681 RepID=UPI001C8AF2E2|nr:uncharacterized protein si:ch211-1a19.2 [Puntigrus tetrazona]